MRPSNAPKCTKMHHFGESSQRESEMSECPKMSDRGETSQRSVGQNKATPELLPPKNPLDIRQGLSRMKAVTFTRWERVEQGESPGRSTLSRLFRRREMRNQIVSKSGRLYSAVG